MTERSLFQYVLNELSVMSDDEAQELDFDAAIRALETIDVTPDDKRQLRRLFTAIKSELPIKHYGVKGMRWGVRRYQNKDGSLTSAGRKLAENDVAKKTVFGTAKPFQVKTRSGETLTAEPVKPWSTGKKILMSLLGEREKDQLGRRGDANYTLKDSKGSKIGELSLKSKDSKNAYLDWITIDEGQRGKGYATDVINNLLDTARSSGYQKVSMNALKKPRALYERIGFTYTDTSQLGIVDRVAGFEFGCKRMEYDLTKLKHSFSDSVFFNALQAAGGITI